MILPVVSPRPQRKDPRVRVLTPKESSADKWHYILIVVPGHRSFIKNMTIGALQANTARNMVPTDGKFTADIAGENHKASEIQEQRLVNVSRLITLGSEADPHRREQDGVRHCRLQAGKVQSSLHRRGVLRQQPDSSWCRSATVSSTCHTEEDDAGPPSAAFD